ncbi:hypothetical protein GO639_03335 [Staphylococcus aureus]|nr:hypothetical protein [Staphylococcus aureus]
MQYASQDWVDVVDLKSSVQHLSSKLKVLGDGAEHASVYDMSVCYDEKQIELCLRDAENYWSGAEVCNKFLDNELELWQLCEVMIELNLRRFLYSLQPYLPEWIIHHFELNDENREEIEDGRENDDYEEEVILDSLYVPVNHK